MRITNIVTYKVSHNTGNNISEDDILVLEEECMHIARLVPSVDEVTTKVIKGAMFVTLTHYIKYDCDTVKEVKGILEGVADVTLTVQEA